MLGEALRDALRSIHKVVAPQALPDRLSILFHELEEEQWPAFRAFAAHYRAAGYRFVSLADYLRSQPGEKVLFVSFDDNLRCWFHALELFDELGVTATFYINTLPIRGRAARSEIGAFLEHIGYDPRLETLSADEIRALHRAGHTIGCHTHSHADLASLPEAGAEVEITTAKQILEDIIGAPVVDFSYPFGMRRFFNERLRTYCKSAGFKTVAAGIPGRLYEPHLDPFDLQRTRWRFANAHERNVEDVAIDGRWFEAMTGRSAVG